MPNAIYILIALLWLGFVNTLLWKANKTHAPSLRIEPISPRTETVTLTSQPRTHADNEKQCSLFRSICTKFLSPKSLKFSWRKVQLLNCWFDEVCYLLGSWLVRRRRPRILSLTHKHFILTSNPSFFYLLLFDKNKKGVILHCILVEDFRILNIQEGIRWLHSKINIT